MSVPTVHPRLIVNPRVGSDNRLPSESKKIYQRGHPTNPKECRTIDARFSFTRFSILHLRRSEIPNLVLLRYCSGHSIR